MSENNERILLVDDEEDILNFLSYNLRKEGFDVITASNGIEAVEMAKSQNPDLIVLDIMMPGKDGVMVCKELRADPALDHTIIAFLTARNEEYTHIAALDLGGDDFITKPVKPAVFLSRVQALLRRRQRSVKDVHALEDTLHVGNLIIDKNRYTVSNGDEEIDLVKKEFELLFLLASKPGKVFNREEILKTVWGQEIIVGNRTIDVHVRRLREKIGQNYIKTVKGIGYKFEF